MARAAGAPEGDMAPSVAEAGRDAYSMPMPGIPDDLRERFVRGRALFRQVWVIAPSADEAVDGLGPVFNRLSCIACHPRNGRGFAPGGPTEELRAMLVRLSVPGDRNGAPPVPHPDYGDQLNELGIPGVPGEGRAAIHYVEREVVLSDGTRVPLRAPSIRFRDLAFGDPGPTLMTSARIGPSVFGLGLLEAVPDATLEHLAARRGPHPGRVNRVWDAALGRNVPGRFGAKANETTLTRQVATAAHGDLGLTSSLHPVENCTPAQTACGLAPSGGSPELSDAQLDDLVTYLRFVGAPARRTTNDAVVRRGEQLFGNYGCADCHVPTLRTAVDARPAALAGKTFHPYTDLLLHDMGEDLADGRPDHLAGGRDWRTPALWGIGLASTVEPRAGFLHDGRARSLLEAILWHGGEAIDACDAVRQASPENRSALLRFLESL
jgi:CxxC motif-containing protein (DUF1111 family)